MYVPFFRPEITKEEIREVNEVLFSGWLTTGPRVKRFEAAFANAVGARYAVAVNSGTAALHLAVEAQSLMAGQAVLVPTMTFAATAEVVRYQGAVPILVDCDPFTLNMNLADGERKIDALYTGALPPSLGRDLELVGVIPVHVGGSMMNLGALESFARGLRIWVVEDAAHAFPAAWREEPSQPWRRCGEHTASVTCFSFYANKTITTGEGGMAVTDDDSFAERMRLMSLHGLSQDAWKRYQEGASWDYRIIAPGFKYNLADIAAAIGIHQIERAEEMRFQRETIAHNYLEAFSNVDELELPPVQEDSIQAWHLFPVKLNLERLKIDRNTFIDKLKEKGVGCSVHWRPLHLHPYYQRTFAWKPEHFPVATKVWPRLISLPLFPAMRAEEIDYVVEVVKDLCMRERC